MAMSDLICLDCGVFHGGCLRCDSLPEELARDGHRVNADGKKCPGAKPPPPSLPVCSVAGYSSPTLPGHLFLGNCTACGAPVFNTPPTVIDTSGAPSAFVYVHFACAPRDTLRPPKGSA